MNDKVTRVARLSKAAAERAERAHAAAQRAITALDARGKAVSFTSVAEEAAVSVSYLYKDPELARRIRDLRGKPGATVRAQMAPESKTSDRSLATKLHAALDRIATLEREKAQLQKENRSLLSRLMDSA